MGTDLDCLFHCYFREKEKKGNAFYKAIQDEDPYIREMIHATYGYMALWLILWGSSCS